MLLLLMVAACNSSSSSPEDPIVDSGDIPAVLGFTANGDIQAVSTGGKVNISGWATVTADHADREMKFELLENSNPDVFLVQPEVSFPEGALSFTPKNSIEGIADLAFALVDQSFGVEDTVQVDETAIYRFTVTIANTIVNHAPVIQIGPDVTATSTGTQFEYPGWLQKAKDGDGSNQQLKFEITENDHPELFEELPWVSFPSLTLRFTPKFGSQGVARLKLRAVDDGGAADGGKDTSVEHSFVITLQTPVVTVENKPPSFAVGEQLVYTDSSELVVLPGWAKNVSDGEDDAENQALYFVVESNSNKGLFEVQPWVSYPSLSLRFTPKEGASGTAEISLSVREKLTGLSSEPQTFKIQINNALNHAPIADAGPDQIVVQGRTIVLNASSSSDVDGDLLNFHWELLIKPEGSKALLANSENINPSFIADAFGQYTVQLIVGDGQEDSAADIVIINVQRNTPPIADAGNDQTVALATLATLDGSGSSDTDGDVLTYLWSISSKPEGSQAALNELTSLMPTFITDLPGEYVLGLVVNDGQTDSPLNTVVVSTNNTSPVANAGDDQQALAGATVTLQGSQSSDADGDAISYTWLLLSKPAGSTAGLTSTELPNPQFVADLPGQYVAKLTVNDAVSTSQTDTVVINVEKANTRPVADAGPDQSIYVGTTVNLDALASHDVDGDALAYKWSIVGKPQGSQAVLSNTDSRTSSFAVGLAGEYIIQLIVNDGQVDSIADQVVISTLNSRPVAVAGVDSQHRVGATVILDARMAFDADGDALSYRWSLLNQPDDSSAAVDNSLGVQVSLTLDTMGFYVVQLIVSDGVLESLPVTLTITSEPSDELTIAIDSPLNDSVTNWSLISIGGYLNHKAQLLINDIAVPVASDLSFTFDEELIEGPNSFVFVATNVLGQSNETTLIVTRDTIAPSAAETVLITVSAPDVNNTVLITGGEGSVEPFAQVIIRNERTGDIVIVTSDSEGRFGAELAGVGADTFSIVIEDEATNSSNASTVAGSSGPVIPPDPASVAPALDPVRYTTFKDSTSFLYTATNPIQTGVLTDTIIQRQAAVIRGKVFSSGDTALSGVTVSIKDHPEFGQTISRADGGFDLVVNGGGILTLNYVREGYLPAQRQVHTTWEDYSHADDVILVVPDSQVNVIDLGNTNDDYQVAQGSVSKDVDGERQATVLFPKGTTATMTLADGSTQALTELHVRATEYTIGDDGPNRMPGELPPASGYTYAVELSVDEAIAANAKRVDFSRALPFYVNNFLDFPVGEIVPLGWYDYDKAVWIPADNGRVIEILSISDGRAQLDVDGDGEVDSNAELTDVGITEGERAILAELYQAGKQLWRVQITHFTPWDCNWPYGPPLDAKSPRPKPKIPKSPYEEQDNCEGCSIQPQSQSLGEEIPIIGTPYKLHYQSQWMPGYKANQTLDIPLTGDSVPSSLMGIELTIRIAGQTHSEYFNSNSNPNQSYRFVWDGRDGFGRSLTGEREAMVEISYIYRPVYYASNSNFSRSFAVVGGSVGGNLEAIGRREASTLKIKRTWERLLVGPSALSKKGLGGWGLSVFHAYSSEGNRLELGMGGSKSTSDVASVISTSAGGVRGYFGDDGPALDAKLSSPYGFALSPDGGYYIADSYNNRIRRVDPDGVITTVAGNGDRGYSGDGGPAVEAMLFSPSDVAVGADGSLYIADKYNSRIRRVSPSGTITSVAGTGIQGDSGDGGLAIQAMLDRPNGVTLGQDGSLYIVDTENSRIRRVSPDSIITTVAGSGYAGYSGDGGLATEGKLHLPTDVAVGPDGSLYIADSQNSRIRRVTPEGYITTVAGVGTQGFSGDGGLALQAELFHPYGVALDPEGSIYIADGSNNRIRVVSPDGVITTVAGTGIVGNWGASFSGDGGPASQAQLKWPRSISLASDGSLYVADSGNHRIRQIDSPLLNGNSVPASSGDQIFAFLSGGRHLHTLAAVTGFKLYQFRYDSEGYITEIEDSDDNVTVIERSSATPIAIVSPDGQRTDLDVDSNGYLSKVTDPAGNSWATEYTSDGLLTAFTDRNGNRSDYSFLEDGKLYQDVNAIGGGWQLASSKTNGGLETTMTTGEGRISHFKMESLSTGVRRHTNTAPNGTQMISDYSGSITTSTLANGTVSKVIKGPDARFGMLAPLNKEVSVTLPSGLSFQSESQRTAALTDPTDILSILTLTESKTLNGRVFKSALDATTNTWVSTSAEGRISTTVFDEKNRPLEIQSKGLEPILLSYDTRGRLNTITEGERGDSRSTILAYQEVGGQAGYLASITDALNRETTFSYNAVGLITKQTLPDGREISYSYDANGNMVDLVPSGRSAHIFHYTAGDQEEFYLPPELNGVDSDTFYQYNKDKQLTLVTSPDAKTMSFNYNSATGQLDEFAIPRGNYSYIYDETSGQIKSITAPDRGGLDFSYDGFLSTGTDWTGAVTGSVNHRFDNNFWITSRSINDDSISYSYDNDGLLTTAGSLSIGRETQNGGLINGTILDSLSTARTYNGFSELSSYQVNSDTQTLAQWIYTRDKLGRINGVSETLGGITTTHEYSYDLAGRIGVVKKDGTTLATYAYDSNGNRNGGIYNDQDQLLDWGQNSYSYSLNGELKSKKANNVSTTYDYDVLGSLIQAHLPGDITIDYVIDGLNRRIGKKVNGALTQGFLYKDQLNPIAELASDSTVVARFVYGDKANVPAYMIKGGKSYRIVSDHLGSPRLVIDSSDGSIVQRMDYDVWGRVTQDTNPGFQPFGFAGGLYDQHTQLVRFGARDYDPEVGRWTSKDPIRFTAGDSNLYSYVFIDPINLVDPNGEVAVQAVASVIGATMGGYSAYQNGGNIISGAIIGGVSSIISPASIVSTIAIGVAGNLAGQAIDPCFNGFNAVEAAAAGVLSVASPLGTIFPSNAVGGALAGHGNNLIAQTVGGAF